MHVATHDGKPLSAGLDLTLAGFFPQSKVVSSQLFYILIANFSLKMVLILFLSQNNA